MIFNEEWVEKKLKTISEFEPINDPQHYYIMGAMDVLKELLEMLKDGTLEIQSNKKLPSEEDMFKSMG